MELQEILGCLSDAEKLRNLPLSELKKASKKYPYLSELKLLIAKKDTSSTAFKEHLLSSRELIPSLQLSSEFDINESDPSLLIRIVKKKTASKKQTTAPILQLKKTEKEGKTEKLTLVKKKSPKTQGKLAAEQMETIKVDKKDVSKTPPKTSRPPQSKTAKTPTTLAAGVVKDQTRTKASQKKRSYVRKSTLPKKLEVAPINPPLPKWKEIISEVKLKENAVPKKVTNRKKYSTSNLKVNKTTRGKASITKASSSKTKAESPSIQTRISKATKLKKLSVPKTKKKKDILTLASSQTKKKKTKTATQSKVSVKLKKKESGKSKGPISNKKTRLKFSEWLTAKSKNQADTTKKKSSKGKKKNSLKQRVKSSVVKKEEIATVTLAKLYTDQGHYKKAIKVYERLRLLNPQKSSFFASKIRKLKQK